MSLYREVERLWYIHRYFQSQWQSVISLIQTCGLWMPATAVRKARVKYVSSYLNCTPCTRNSGVWRKTMVSVGRSPVSWNPSLTNSQWGNPGGSHLILLNQFSQLWNERVTHVLLSVNSVPSIAGMLLTSTTLSEPPMMKLFWSL